MRESFSKRTRLGRIRLYLPTPASLAGMVASLLLLFSFSAAAAAADPFAEGYRFQKEHRYEEALRRYAAVPADAPEHGAALFNSGVAAYTAGWYDTAARFFTACRNFVDTFSVSYNLGNSLYREGKFKEAVEAYKQALRTRPGEERAAHNLALALEHLRGKSGADTGARNDTGAGNSKQPSPRADSSARRNPSPRAAQNPPASPKQQGLDRDQAQQILDALDDADKKTREKLAPIAVPRAPYVEKDW